MPEPAPALLLCGHGSRDPAGVAPVAALAATLQTRYPGRAVAHGFLELARPDFATAVAGLYATGAREITAVPLLLLTAGHAKHDLPAVLNRLQARHTGLRIRMGRPLGLAAGVVASATKLAARALGEGSGPAARDAALVVVGRGTSDPDANGDVAKLARMVGERVGFGFATAAYVAVTEPRLPAGLSLASALPFRRIVVLPAVLFDGVLFKGIAAGVAAYPVRPGQSLHLTPPLAADDAWLGTLDERIAEADAGAATMNCQLCTYRHAALARQTAACCGHHHHDHGALPASAPSP